MTREATVWRCRSGGALIDDGSVALDHFPDWREAVAAAYARGLSVPNGVPPLLPPVGQPANP